MKKSYYEMKPRQRIEMLGNNVPALLKKMPIWLLWRGVHNSQKDKWDKHPYYANGRKRHGTNGSAEDRAALVTFDDALAAMKADQNITGLGIALLEDMGVVALDLDQVSVNQAAASLAAKFKKITYTELSPSGNGHRAFFIGKTRSRKKAPVEIFGASGFVTVTGWQANKKPIANYNAAPPELEAHFAHAPAPEGTSPKVSTRRIREVLEDIPNDDLDYDQWLTVIAAIHDARQGDSVGQKLANEWSQASTKHDNAKFESSWESFGRRDTGAPLVTFGTLMHLAGHAKDGESEQRSPFPALVSPSLEALKNPEPPPAELWGGYIRKGIVTVLAGPGGSYKSALLLAMVVQRCRTGGKYLDQPVAPGKTLVVLAEDRTSDTVRRLSSLAKHFHILPQPIRDGVGILQLTGTEWTSLIDVEYGKPVVTETGKHIEQAARSCEADLIVVETANRVAADETNPVFRKLIAELERIAMASGAAVVLTSHVSKSAGRAGTDDHHAARGGGALTDNARSVLVISYPEEGTEEHALGMRVLTHAKSTHSEPVRQVLLEITKLPFCGLPELSDKVPAKEKRREVMKLSEWERARLVVEKATAKLDCDYVTKGQMRSFLRGSGVDYNNLAGILETAVMKGVLEVGKVKHYGREYDGYRTKGKRS